MTINGFGNSANTYYHAQKTLINKQEIGQSEAKFNLPKAEELNHMQKTGGFVNTMAELSPSEKSLYDELIEKGESDAAQGLLLIAMSRIDMKGKQITLPNGNMFDPTTTEVTAMNVRKLFKQVFVSDDGHTDRIFDALATALEKKL